jgi:hypothetical protein
LEKRISMADTKTLKTFLGMQKDNFSEVFAKDTSKLAPGKLAKNKKFGETPARYTITIDSIQGGVEKYYFWVVRMLQTQSPFGLDFRQEAGDSSSGKVESTGRIEKVKDLFTATESSSYFGAIEQKKGLQQDKASNYLATIGKMIKDIFQLIRELRIIDERLAYYNGVNSGDKSSDYALKGIWIDIVEGASKNPSSVYGLANQVGFATLPDLFFTTNVKTAAEVDSAVESSKLKAFNRKVKEVLARKLKQYLIWKEKTEKEIRTRRNFLLKYLRQHYNIIKMYMNWLRPYLKNVRQLQMDSFDFTDPDLVRAFETAKVELEILAIKHVYESDDYLKFKEPFRFQYYFPVLRIRFYSTTIPMMQFQSEYQRGPVHAGQNHIIMEGFYATKDEIANYKKAIAEEDFEILSSLFSAMDAMKDELKAYLHEAGETSLEAHHTEEKEFRKPSVLDPITGIFHGFRTLFSGFAPAKKDTKSNVSEKVKRMEKGAASGAAGTMIYTLYYVFKKAFRMVTE